MPDFAAWQWLLGALCAFMIGVAKTGVPGVLTLIIPITVLLIGDARLAAAWNVPLLSTADLFAVVYWRRSHAAKRLFSLLPWVAIGMALGAASLRMPELLLRRLVGGTVILMLAIHVLRKWRPNSRIHGNPPLFGISGGFATVVANAAGPVMNLYLMSKNLPKEEFVATGAWFFFVVNLSKFPIYYSVGLFSKASILYDLCLVPVVVLGSMTGRWILRHMRQDVFDTTVAVLTVLSAILLFR